MQAKSLMRSAPRLEQFFYKTVVQDLQIMTYNHARALETFSGESSKQDNHTYSVFSSPMAELVTRPLEGATSQLSSLYTKPAKLSWDRPVKNILFGKSRSPTKREAGRPDDPRPRLLKVKLKIYTDAAITNKYK